MSISERIQPEEEALLPGSRTNERFRKRLLQWPIPLFRRWKAHPFWLIPIVLVANVARGITTAPRIQVYNAIACRMLNDYNSGSLLMDECEDPDVRAKAAKIQAAVVTTMSVLSAITTGFWSRLGDNHGRKPVFCVFLIGALLMELVYVLVMKEDSIFGQYAGQFILLGPVAEGFVGGLSVFNGVIHAYTSDCTRHGSRSRIFSILQGMVSIGLALGPWLTGVFIPATGYNPAYFYISITLLAVTFVYVIIIPESREPQAPASDEFTNSVQFKSTPFLAIRKRVISFLNSMVSPIAMFGPRSIPGHPTRKTYNLTFVGLSLFIYIVSTAVYATKYMFAQHLYSWTTTQLGFYLSLLWISRAINLLVLLPIVISYLKPKTTNATPTAEDIAAEMKFDKFLAQVSLGIDATADTLVAVLSSKSQASFIVLSCISSFTSGGNPSMHSLAAVCLHACGYSSEVGALFGAIGVINAIAHIISPYIFAVTYASTVAFFPQAIFVLGASLLGSSIILLYGTRANVSDIALVHSSHPESDNDSGYVPIRNEDDESSSH